MSDTAPWRLGTRGSDLALWQSRHVAALLEERSGRGCELKIMKTTGDLDRSRPVADLGQVGVFTKELERALLEREVDLAVHSLKDLPTEIPPGLVVAAQPERTVVHDLLIARPEAVTREGEAVPLREGARVGTASLRRRAQLLEVRPDLEVVPIRGNVPTRVDKARTGEVDAVVLAAAGIGRLGLDMTGLRAIPLPLDQFVPAPGQGALAIEVRADDEPLRAALLRMDDPGVSRCTTAERLLLHELGVGCSVPLGAHAVQLPDGALLLRAVLGPAVVGARPRLRHALVRARQPRDAARLALQALGPQPVSPAPTPALAGKRVLILREEERARELIEAVEAAGGSARARPPLALEARLPAEAVRRAVAELPERAWVLFASAAGVAHLVAALGPEAPAQLARLRVAAVGPATADALARAGVALDLLPQNESGEGLAGALLHRPTPDPVGVALLPAAAGGRPELREQLQAAGWDVRPLELYGSRPLGPLAGDELAGVDAVVVASPAGGQAALTGATLGSRRLVAIGGTTAAALRTQGLEVAAVAEHPTSVGLLEALARALA